MGYWTKSELALSVLAALAAILAGRFLGPLLGQLLSSSALPSLFLMFLFPIPVMALPFFHWDRRGKPIWPWVTVLIVCLGVIVLLTRNLPVAARIIAVFTDFYDLESTGFYLLFALLICGGMLVGVLVGALLARLFPKERTV